MSLRRPVVSCNPKIASCQTSHIKTTLSTWKKHNITIILHVHTCTLHLPHMFIMFHLLLHYSPLLFPLTRCTTPASARKGPLWISPLSYEFSLLLLLEGCFNFLFSCHFALCSLFCHLPLVSLLSTYLAQKWRWGLQTHKYNILSCGSSHV